MVAAAYPDVRAGPAAETPRTMSLFVPRRRRHRRLAPGSYLTDGERLFRVLSLLVAGRSMLVSIEDCRTLEIHAYADSELETMRLRRVRGRHSHGPASPPRAGMREIDQPVVHRATCQ